MSVAGKLMGNRAKSWSGMGRAYFQWMFAGGARLGKRRVENDKRRIMNEYEKICAMLAARRCYEAG
jgi:hypothetical protein